MFAWIGAALGIVNKLLGAVSWFTKRSDEDRQREAGRSEQKLADAELNIQQGHEGHAIDGEVARLSDDELDRRLRKRARPKRT
jgi:hypothetical protein